MDPQRIEALQSWLGSALSESSVKIDDVHKLDGGAIQENWRVQCSVEGSNGHKRDFVLRCDAQTTIASSRTRAEEYAIIEAAHQAGVRVPAPLAACDDPEVIGAPFFLMGWVDGVSLGPRIVKDTTLGGDRMGLGEQLGRELAKVHGIRIPQASLSFLGEPDPDPVESAIGNLRASLDRLGASRPCLEWGLRWAETHAPARSAPTLVHHDFRTGNYIVDQQGLAAILDWEFAGWGDPMSDLGWFCAECWRFGRPDLEAGGVAPRATFYRGYEAESGSPVDDDAVRFWEVFAHLRWAVIALEQAERHLSGRELSLELALTGRIVPELELTVLKATEPARWRHAP
jgi:aminoglycoside phosphotransferase (APT) family kinase protein